VSQRHVPEALRAAGHEVFLRRDVFARGTLDVDWLPRVGAERWVPITKDENIRKRPIEVAALMRAKVRAFVLTAAGEMTGAEQGALIAKALPRIEQLASRRPPFIANITASGYVQMLDVPKYRV
jgi:hypothetical protein